MGRGRRYPIFYILQPFIRYTTSIVIHTQKEFSILFITGHCDHTPVIKSSKTVNNTVFNDWLQEKARYTLIQIFRWYKTLIIK